MTMPSYHYDRRGLLAAPTFGRLGTLGIRHARRHNPVPRHAEIKSFRANLRLCQSMAEPLLTEMMVAVVRVASA
jgi:hypothetical protein